MLQTQPPQLYSLVLVEGQTPRAIEALRALGISSIASLVAPCIAATNLSLDTATSASEALLANDCQAEVLPMPLARPWSIVGANDVAEAVLPASAAANATLILVHGGDKKINVIKEVRGFRPDLGLKEAKDLVEGAPSTVLTNVTEAEAKRYQSGLEAAGATAAILKFSEDSHQLVRLAVRYELTSHDHDEYLTSLMDFWSSEGGGDLLVSHPIALSQADQLCAALEARGLEVALFAHIPLGSA